MLSQMLLQHGLATWSCKVLGRKESFMGECCAREGWGFGKLTMGLLKCNIQRLLRLRIEENPYVHSKLTFVIPQPQLEDFLRSGCRHRSPCDMQIVDYRGFRVAFLCL
jgi:hypothetical protein